MKPFFTDLSFQIIFQRGTLHSEKAHFPPKKFNFSFQFVRHQTLREIWSEFEIDFDHFSEISKPLSISAYLVCCKQLIIQRRRLIFLKLFFATPSRAAAIKKLFFFRQTERQSLVIDMYNCIRFEQQKKTLWNVATKRYEERKKDKVLVITIT